MQAFVITLREGIEAALVIAIIVAYLHKTGRAALMRWVWMGLSAAIFASGLVAAMVWRLGLDLENEYLEGTLFGLAGVFVATMVLWMWRAARNLKGHIESSVEASVSKDADPGLPWTQGLGLFAVTFLMVFREGAEMVLFLAASALGEAASPLQMLGGLSGLALALTFALLFVRGSLRMNLGRFFTVTGVVLLVLAAKLLAQSLHEFGELKVIPLTKELMAFLGYLVRDESSAIIVALTLAVPLAAILWDVRSPAVPAGPPEPAGPVERRMRLAASNRERAWRGALAMTLLSILGAMVWSAWGSTRLVDPTPVAAGSSQGFVRIPIDSLEVGKLHKFMHRVGEADVRFLAVRLPDGTVATALDACQICGAVGFAQEGDKAICKNCNAPIAMHTLSEGGGCNPLPLTASIEGGDLLIALSDLQSASGVFTR